MPSAMESDGIDQMRLNIDTIESEPIEVEVEIPKEYHGENEQDQNENEPDLDEEIHDQDDECKFMSFSIV